jgi:hypothetical protein
MATYVNNLRLKEITTGDEDGTWGTSTNTNLELITDGFSYGTKEMAADANETFTMPDATADDTRSFYLKITSAVSLTATREVTLGPNTVSKVWMIENATSGSQIITIKQGSGATVNVPNGSKVMIVTDGAGAGAAVFNANPTEVGGTVTSVGGTGTVNGLTLTGTVTTSGNLTLGGALTGVNLTSQVTGTLPVANGGTGATTLTANNVILGNGTSAVQAVAPGTSGNVLTSDGTTWVSSAAAAGLTGVTDSATPFVTALGSGAAGNVTTGLHNLAIGYRSLCAVTTSCSNTAVGNCTLTSFTSGISVHGLTAFGFCALRSVTGTGNAGFGCCALASNSSGTFNAAFGNNALGSASAANSHTAVGHGALRNVVSPIGNTAVGSQASCNTSTGERNTSVGTSAHYRNSTGSHNVAIGDHALQDGTTGCNNIAIGENAASTTAVSAAPLGFNNITTESNRITMGNDSHDCALIKIAWTVVSDCRDKTCFKEVPHGIDFVRALKPTEYQFKKKRDLDEPDGVKRYGFLAQDIMALEGESPVVTSADDPDKLKYNEAHMVPILVKAIKDLADEIDKIKDLINKT